MERVRGSSKRPHLIATLGVGMALPGESSGLSLPAGGGGGVLHGTHPFRGSHLAD